MGHYIRKEEVNSCMRAPAWTGPSGKSLPPPPVWRQMINPRPPHKREARARRRKSKRRAHHAPSSDLFFRSGHSSSESVRGVIRAHPRTHPDWFVRRGGRARAFEVRVVFQHTRRRRSPRASADEKNDPRPVRGAPHLRFARVDQAEEARSGEQAAQSVSRENWQSRVVIVAKRRVQSARFEYT